MSSQQQYKDSVLRQQWTSATLPGDPTPAGYTAWDANGNVTTQRALTADEAAGLAIADSEANASANQSTLQTQATAALAANRADQTQDQTIITNAATISGTTGTLTSAQLSNFVRQLAQGVSILAQNDINAKKELNALIRLALQQFDATN